MEVDRAVSQIIEVAAASLGAYTSAMWKTLRLILCLVFFVPAFALLVVCAVVGLFLGRGFGGFRVR
jgi:hypothetical protein